MLIDFPAFQCASAMDAMLPHPLSFPFPRTRALRGGCDYLHGVVRVIHKDLVWVIVTRRHDAAHPDRSATSVRSSPSRSNAPDNACEVASSKPPISGDSCGQCTREFDRDCSRASVVCRQPSCAAGFAKTASTIRVLPQPPFTRCLGSSDQCPLASSGSRDTRPADKPRIISAQSRPASALASSGHVSTRVQYVLGMICCHARHQ